MQSRQKSVLKVRIIHILTIQFFTMVEKLCFSLKTEFFILNPFIINSPLIGANDDSMA